MGYVPEAGCFRHIVGSWEMVSLLSTLQNEKSDYKRYFFARKLWTWSSLAEISLKSMRFGASSCSVDKSCPTLCNPMDHSTPRSPVLPYLLEFAQFIFIWGFPGGASSKEPACQCRRHEMQIRSRKIPWRREWQPTPVFVPGESRGQSSLAGYSHFTHVWLFAV